MLALAQLHWPRLHTLAFYGMQRSEQDIPLMQALSPGMASLRRLAVKLNPTPVATNHALWPQNFTCSFPSQALEVLTIPYPNPTDVIYGHLPSSLRELSLRCWKHVFVPALHHHYDEAYWLVLRDNWILSAGALLSILRRCEVPNLVKLEVKYLVDDDVDTLMQYIATALPDLTTLKISSYRQSGAKKYHLRP